MICLDPIRILIKGLDFTKAFHQVGEMSSSVDRRELLSPSPQGMFIGLRSK